MASLRLWILGVAAGSFATGLIVGSALPGSCAPMMQEDGLADHLDSAYGLSDAQERLVRIVLQRQREVEVAIVLGAQQNQLSPELLGELLATRKKTNDRIRMVLDEEQRARYDEDCRPPGSAPAEGEKR